MRRSPRAWPWALGGLTLGADQLTKHLIATAFAPAQTLPLLPPILHLTYVQNTGAAFGLFKGQQLLFVLLSVGVIIWMARRLLRPSSDGSLALASCGLILGGAAGNLIDRVWLGYVVDFIDLRVWPVFNIADSAITIGNGLLQWHSLRQRHSPREDHDESTKHQIPSTK